jgi:hypothetical protein
MCAIVFGQIKLSYSPKICLYILVPLILKVDISVPPELWLVVSELRVDISVPIELQVDVSPRNGMYSITNVLTYLLHGA